MPVTSNPGSSEITLSRLSTYNYAGAVDILDGRAMEAIPDEVLLSAVLTLADPGVDGDALAVRFLSGQRTLEEAVVAVIHKTIRVKELDAQASVRLQALIELAARLVRPSLAKSSVYLEHAALVTYCRLRAACVPVQQLRTIFFDDRKQLVADEVHQTGTINDVKGDIRGIMHRALELGACGLVVSQSAPADEPPKPWGAKSLYADLQRAGAVLGVELYDYLLIGRRSYSSFSQHIVKERGGKKQSNNYEGSRASSAPAIPAGE